MRPGTLHMIVGATGAGKTTYAIALAAREGALRLSIDDWMGQLFWMDAPADLGTWAFERVKRCTAQMRAVLAETCPLGLPAVLDAGFTTRGDRAYFGDWAEAAGIPCRLHWLDVDATTRRARVTARNAAGGGGTGFAVTEAMFDGMEAMWEAPTAAEMARWQGLRIGADETRGPGKGPENG